MRRTTRNGLVLIALLTLGTPVAIALVGSGAAPCSGEEYSQFDFWVGDWVVTTPDGTQVGTNRIEKILNGCVVMENWEGAQGTSGKSFNMFFNREGKWRQSWVDNSGGRLDIEGGWQDGKMTLSGKMPGKDGKPVLHEISYTPRPDGTVRQHWRASKNKGKDWQDLFDGIYTRK